MKINGFKLILAHFHASLRSGIIHGLSDAPHGTRRRPCNRSDFRFSKAVGMRDLEAVQHLAFKMCLDMFRCKRPTYCLNFGSKWVS